MGRYHSVPQSSSRVRYEMILSLVSSVLFASVALGAPGASNYGAAAVVGPAKQIASTPSIQCRTEYVTLWDTEYHKRFPVRVSRQEPKKVCDEGSVHAPLAAPVHQAAPSVQDLLNYGVPAVPTQAVPEVILARDKQKLQNATNDDRIVFG